MVAVELLYVNFMMSMEYIHTTRENGDAFWTSKIDCEGKKKTIAPVTSAAPNDVNCYQQFKPFPQADRKC